MSRRSAFRDEQRLGERLRQEAIDTWPTYSKSLHNRIMSAIEQQETKNETAMPNRRWDVVRLGRWMAFAAACVVGILVLGWQSVQRENDPHSDAIALASSQFGDDLPRRVVAETLMPGVPLRDGWVDTNMKELGGLVVSAAVTSHSDNLKHDTRLAAETLLERLPIDMEMFAGPER